MQPSRREVLGSLSAGLIATSLRASVAEPVFRLATFVTEVTCPLGHPLMGGGIAPAKEIVDPLFVHGLVLLSEDKPVVLAAVDWCEIRNDAYEAWRQALARAVKTTTERVLVTSVHQHDAPIADLEAQRLLDKHKATGRICDLEFHEQTVARVGRAAAACLDKAQPITHIGTGRAKVAEIASNRRYVTADGKPHFGRTSATRDATIRAYPEGTVDPWLKMLSFWQGDKPLVAISAYATHPMSYYGKGGVSADFVGLARRSFQAAHPGLVHLYVSGCSGNVTAGKYNDGAADNRPVLARRLEQAMSAAWKATRKQALTALSFRRVPLRLEPRNDARFTVAALTERLKSDQRPIGQCLAALGLSWRKRADAGHKLDLPLLDLGGASFVLLPGESYVEYQLAAQRLRPDDFVMVAGYGECAPGYVPTEQAFKEHDTNLDDWCWVAPGAEKAMHAALKQVMQDPESKP
ncbi:MAG: hypothetical protein AB7K24_19875 [Gemmataceae bacterium]